MSSNVLCNHNNFQSKTACAAMRKSSSHQHQEHDAIAPPRISYDFQSFPVLRSSHSLSHIYFLYFFFLFCFALQQTSATHHVGGGGSHHLLISNATLAGFERGCKHRSSYFVTKNLQFPMCMGQSEADLKNGMSIVNLIYSRGYLPTCRVLHLMLWMASEVQERGRLTKDYFLDVGANIGSCSNHIAALGFPTVSVEPVLQHVETIQGTIDINPSFNLELHHNGISHTEKSIHANFGHGSRNWGASEFHEVGKNESFELELRLKTVDQIIGNRRVALMKIDCEGCEWEALKGAKRTLKKTPMLKIELVQPSYTAGNETVYAKDIIKFLDENGYELFIETYNEQHLYFGKHGDKILDIDKLFGSAKFNLEADRKALIEAAQSILNSQLEAATFDQKAFLKRGTDVVAIQKDLSTLMKKHFLH